MATRNIRKKSSPSGMAVGIGFTIMFFSFFLFWPSAADENFDFSMVSWAFWLLLGIGLFIMAIGIVLGYWEKKKTEAARTTKKPEGPRPTIPAYNPEDYRFDNPSTGHVYQFDDHDDGISDTNPPADTGHWVCGKCGYINTEPSESCSLCHTPKNGDAPEEK